MTTDQVVAALAADGYSRDTIMTAIDSFDTIDPHEDGDWTKDDLILLRAQLCVPVAGMPEGDDSIAVDPVDSTGPAMSEAADTGPAEPSTEVNALFRFDIDEWATDLGRVLERTTAGQLTFNFEQLRQIAVDLLRNSFGTWDPEASSLENEEDNEQDHAGSVPNFSVERWASHLNETIVGVTDGTVRLDRVDLEVAANLLLHGQEDEWIPQACRLRRQHERDPWASH